MSTNQRVDIELLVRRTVSVFGREFVCAQSAVSSLSEFIDAEPAKANTVSDDFDSEERVRFVHETLCRRMAIEPHSVTLAIVNDDQLTEAFAYQPSRDDSAAEVQVNSLVADDDLRLVTTIANALAFHVWTKRGDRDLDTDPRTTMLLPVIMGLGVLVADAALYDDQWSTGGWSGWSLSRLGHYNAMEVGFAMACVATLCGDDKPAWMTSLRLDARATAKRSLRYFRDLQSKGGERLLDASRVPSETREESVLANWIAGEDPDWAVAALRTVSQRAAVADTYLSSAVLDSTIAATKSTDQAVQTSAITAFAFANPESMSPAIESALMRLSKSRSPQTVLAAIESATALGLPHGSFLDSADWLLQRESFDQLPVADWVRRGGTQCVVLQPVICAHLVDAIRFDHQVAMQALASCLSSISDDVEAVIRRYVRDPEMQTRAREITLQQSK
ncbi:hypothetical protein [Rubripirellula amarantea]|uniref:hypothetical protein n=1 Tax=Rubripirellula amarantea TaxID=2527999 RepID=UPI0013EF1333|nr:hypothetical protein [Rubripirellula amarantea]